MLIETIVETPRYAGAVYRASGWTRVGTTQGRGRYDRHTKRAQPKKNVWFRPPAKRLATHPQSVGSHPGAAGAGKHANKRITISSSPETRTVATVRPRRGTGDIGIIFPAESKIRKGAGDALCHAPPSIMRRRSPSDKMNVKRGRLSGAGAHARLPDQS